MPVRHEAWPAGTPCWVDLASPDTAATEAFYGAVLGWEFSEPSAEFGGYLNARSGGELVAGIGPTMSREQPAAWTLYFATDDADATAKAIAEAGGTVAVQPVDVADLGRMAIAVDPTGASFGIWQAGHHLGISRYNEPGGLTWEEAWVPDLDRAKTFYEAVFGFTFTAMADMPGYETFATNGAELGGLGRSSDGPPHWAAYFSVTDVDAAVAKAVELGGTLVNPPMDTPNGRLAEITDSHGAALKLVSLPT